MKQKVRVASAEKRREKQDDSGRDNENRKVSKKQSFGSLGKVGATRRLFAKSTQ